MKINTLYDIIRQRSQQDPAQSYTARLFAAGEDEIVKKVGEEAIETILAAKAQGNARLVEEVADLTYHLLVLLAYHDLSPQAIEDELERRHKPA